MATRDCHSSIASIRALHAACEGWQDETNGAYVAGWAWDPRHSSAPVSVEVYDGDALLATIAADVYREDLRDAGKGKGRHGFVYPLAGHLRDRRAHRITVRIAGTGVVLRDPATGAPPQPVTRHDAPRGCYELGSGVCSVNEYPTPILPHRCRR